MVGAGVTNNVEQIIALILTVMFYSSGSVNCLKTNSDAAKDDTFGIMTTLGFQCYSFQQKSCTLKDANHLR